MLNKRMVVFFNISIEVIWIVVFLHCKKTVSESLILKYGFKNQLDGYCQNFDFNTTVRQITFKDANGSVLLKYINSTNPIFTTKVPYINGSFANNSLTLCFWNLSREDIGTYILEESISRRKINVTIDVYHEANILLEGDFNINEYQDANIICRVDSNPPANITWRLPIDLDGRVQRDGNNSTLSISNCTCAQTGKYVCLASNKEDKVVEKEVFLNVTCRPAIAKEYRFHDDKIYASIGDSLEYSINFTANPSPKIIKDGDLNVTRISLDAVTHTLFIQKYIRDPKDFKQYVISVRNNLGDANLTLNIVQQEIKMSDMKTEWLVIGILSVGVVVTVAVSVSVVCGWRKRKKRNVVYNGDYRDNILYEPTPMDFISSISQQASVDTISIRSRDIDNSSTTDLEQLSEKKNKTLDSIAPEKSYQNGESSKQRKKPVPTPRRNKRILKSDFQNKRDSDVEPNTLIEAKADICLHQFSYNSNAESLDNQSKYTMDSDAKTSFESLKNGNATLVQSGCQRNTPNFLEMHTAVSSKNDDHSRFDENKAFIQTKTSKLIEFDHAKPLNYVNVECATERKSPSFVQVLKENTNYHTVSNSGFVVPMKENQNDITISIQNMKTENQTEFTPICHLNRNCQMITEDERIFDVEYNTDSQSVGENYLSDSNANASKHGYIYRWRIRKNSESNLKDCTNHPEDCSVDDGRNDDDYVNCAFGKYTNTT